MGKCRIIISCFFLVSFLYHCLAGAVVGLERMNVVSTQELKQLLLERERGERDFLLVNGLDRLIFRNGAIPGSVNIPWAEVGKHTQLLGADVNRHIITYCMGYR